MKKIFYLFFFLFLTLVSCSNKEIFNYANDAPEWLKARIDSVITANPKYYSGTKVFRYEWNKEYLYHFSIPASSCVYCEVYEQNGKKIQFTNYEMVTDFEKNKLNKILVWDWFSNYK